VAAIDPDFSAAHGNLAVEYAAAGLLDKAGAELRRAIELDPVTSGPGEYRTGWACPANGG
jgi:Tfp pilus assembly protein PilF